MLCVKFMILFTTEELCEDYLRFSPVLFIIILKFLQCQKTLRLCLLPPHWGGDQQFPSIMARDLDDSESEDHWGEECSVPPRDLSIWLQHLL